MKLITPPLLKNNKISNEEFKNRFSDWLVDQSPSNFIVINGYEILREFIKQYLKRDLFIDRTEYRFFISDKRDLIRVIQNWINTFDLSFDDYKIFFESYCKSKVNKNITNLKITFHFIHQSFQNDIIKPNYIIDKTPILKEDLQYIFENYLCEYKKIPKIEREILKRNARVEMTKQKENETINPRIEMAKQIAKDEADALNIKLAKASIEEKEAIELITKYNREYRKSYKQKFPEKIKEAKKIYKNKRIERDISFKLLHRLRTRILLVLHGKRKLESSLKLLGCSPDFLVNHLESKFKDGMTWDNYGVKGWHVDHVMPCASFDFTKIEEQKKCFHYSNLQPLWWHENIIKSDKIL